MTETLRVLAGVALVRLAGAASPGRGFVVIVRAAAARSRATGPWMALGMGLGGTIWAASALFGLAAIFAAAPWLCTLVRWAGAAFLVWLAVTMIRHAQAPPEGAAPPSTPRAALRRATLAPLSNPKAAVFFASVFVAVAPPNASPALFALIVANVLIVATAWYALVALAFSAGPVRGRYLSAKAWVDRVSGGAPGLIGLRLALG